MSLQPRPTCPICGREGKQTAEDVMPLWVRKATLSLVPMDAAAYPPRMTLRICHQCNSEMAARYEDKASQILTPIMKDRPATLETRDQSIIGRWFIKTTLLMNLADQLRQGFVLPADRNALRRMNEDGEVPAGISIRIGRYSAVEGDPEGTVGELDRVVPGGYPGSTSHYSATTLGYLAIEMIVCEPASALDFAAHMAGNARMVPIWPPTLSGLQWPPPETLSRADLLDMRTALVAVQGSPGFRKYFQPPAAGER